MRTAVATQEHEATTRQPLTSRLNRAIRAQFTEFERADLSRFTFEKKRSTYKDASSDLFIYRGDGRLACRGREFGNQLFFWQE